MKLTVCLASRGRPGLLLQTVKRTAANMVLADTKLLICLDEDDETREEFFQLLRKWRAEDALKC